MRFVCVSALDIDNFLIFQIRPYTITEPDLRHAASYLVTEEQPGGIEQDPALR